MMDRLDNGSGDQFDRYDGMGAVVWAIVACGMVAVGVAIWVIGALAN